MAHTMVQRDTCREGDACTREGGSGGREGGRERERERERKGEESQKHNTVATAKS